MPAVEEQGLPLAVTRIRAAIDDQDCLRCRSGYRPPLGVQEAGAKLPLTLHVGQDKAVVEADRKGFFDTIHPAWRLRMVQERREDGAFVRLIPQWRQAGVLDTDGPGLPPTSGTPQGGSVAPVLAKVSLPSPLAWWWPKGVKPRCQGEACRLRDADDWVGAFQSQGDAERFSQA